MKTRFKLFATALLPFVLFAACSLVPQPEGDGAVSSTAQELGSVGQIAVGSSGAVASVDGFATQVGIEVLKDGGNAMDAAIAVGFALAVTPRLATSGVVGS